MIEKIDIPESTVIDASVLWGGINDNVLAAKINEVIDAVNEIMTWRFDCDDGTPAENVQVDEIEQAEKWVGKLCWFSQIYGCHQHIAILKRISESGLYVTDDGELHYAYCEPVKPDDNIIYKGE